jgi:hypothetical protein
VNCTISVRLMVLQEGWLPRCLVWVSLWCFSFCLRWSWVLLSTTHSFFSIFIGPYGQDPRFHHGRMGIRLVYSIFLSFFGVRSILKIQFIISTQLNSFHFIINLETIKNANTRTSFHPAEPSRASHNMQWDGRLSVCARCDDRVVRTDEWM